jgi:hypothetical protein
MNMKLKENPSESKQAKKEASLDLLYPLGCKYNKIPDQCERKHKVVTCCILGYFFSRSSISYIMDLGQLCKIKT